MLLGKIIGKTSTNYFQFKLDQEAKKFDYLKVESPEGIVLCQIIELKRDVNEIIADCLIVGLRKEGKLSPIRTPFSPGLEVNSADDEFIKEILGLEKNNNGVYLGRIENRSLNVFLDINRLLTKHISVLAKSGSGKSYTVGVILEEIIDKKIPVVIIDPHGEYIALKNPNFEEKEKLKTFNLEPKSYLNNIIEYAPDTESNPEAIPLKLSVANLSPTTLIQLLPAKLNNQQIGILYSALKNMNNFDMQEIILSLETEESNAKWVLISILEYIKKLNIFSDNPVSMKDIVQPNKASIINLKGIPPELQEAIVYKLAYDLFDERKKGNIPPFLLVVEEAHNFIPERNYKEAKSSSILRQIAAEGRKFGLGLCLITQRPSRIEKNALSQVSTQIILKITNPNDLRAVVSSVEGITNESAEEIKNLPIGTALVVGAVNVPIFVNIRTRKSKHGGEAVDIMETISSLVNSTQDADLMPIIKQKLSLQDIQIIKGNKDIKIKLIPCIFLKCKSKLPSKTQTLSDFSLLINLNNGQIINNIETASGFKIPEINSLPESQMKMLKLAIILGEFTPSEAFAKSGMQFSEVYDIVNTLANKGFLIRDTKFSLSNSLKPLHDLSKFAVYEKVNFMKVDNAEKLNKQAEPEKIKATISNFTNILDTKECYLIVYT